MEDKKVMKSSSTSAPPGRPMRKLDSRSDMTRSNSASSSLLMKTKSKGKTSESTRSRPCAEHSFLTDVADVRQMEKGLLQLLDDFHSGKLQAFGKDCSFEKMDRVREQQEQLARLHFEMDSRQESKEEADSPESREAANQNMSQLMEKLQELCINIQNLQKNDTAGGATCSTHS